MRCPDLSHSLWLFSCWLGWSSWSFEMWLGRISLNSVLLLLLVNCDGLQVVIDVYISHRKYQVKPHLSPWFSTTCVATIVYKYHFFRLYLQNKSSESKVRFRQAPNHCKSIFEATKCAYTNKMKEFITPQKLGSHYFWWITNSVLSKSKSAIPPLFNGSEVMSSKSDKAKLVAENFSKNSNFDDSCITLFPCRTNLKLYDIQWCNLTLAWRFWLIKVSAGK